jgi:hypothetical protein
MRSNEIKGSIIAAIIGGIFMLVATIITIMSNNSLKESDAIKETNAVMGTALAQITQPPLPSLTPRATYTPLPSLTPYPTQTPYPTSALPTAVLPTATSSPTAKPTLDLKLFGDDFEMGIKPEWGMSGQGYASTNGQLIVSGILESKIVGGKTWGDYEIRVNEFSLTGCCTTVRFLMRAQDNSNYMQLTCREDNADGYAECFWDIVVNGKSESIPGSTFGIMVGGDHLLRVEVKGSQYTTFWDSEQKVRFAKDTFSNGGISLRINPRGKIGSIEVLRLP